MTIPFGKHRGEHVVDCPTGYLTWLDIQEWVRDRFPELAAEVKHELKRRLGDVSSLGRVKSAAERDPVEVGDDYEAGLAVDE